MRSHDGDITRGMNSYFGTDLPDIDEPLQTTEKWGAHGTRYDEECRRCRRVTEIDNNTELCKRCQRRGM